MRHIRKGFTLIELLVVVGIIVILISIILPVVNRSRESARQAACMSNQREVYVALQSYMKDNGDYCPGSATGQTGITGTGMPTVFGVGQLISGNDAFPQSKLEASSQSMMLARGYVKNGAVFHCPQQDIYSAMEALHSGTPAIYHYVFNEYFVGDKPVAVPAGGGAPAVCTPVYSTTEFPNLSTQSALTFNSCQNPSRCVLITEDGRARDTTMEIPQTINGATAYFLVATPWHNVHGKLTSTSTSAAATAYVMADNVICTYVDGHSEIVLARPQTGDTSGNSYLVPSDNGGLFTRR